MKIHYTELSDDEISVIVGRLAGQSNARLVEGQAWVGRGYDLFCAGPDHQEQVERAFGLSTSCQRTEDGHQWFECNGDRRTRSPVPARSRVLGALLATYPDGMVLAVSQPSVEHFQ